MNNPSSSALWQHNPATVQLLGLCPLLAVSNNASSALGLGLATLVVLISSNVCISALRHWIDKDVRIPVFILIIASWVSIVQLLLQAYHFSLYQSLGIFLALITTNCTILARAEALASRAGIGAAALDGLMQGLGFLWVLVVLGMLRELIGYGSVFGYTVPWPLPGQYSGFLLVILPPGAFICLGLLIALFNHWQQHNRHNTID